VQSALVLATVWACAFPPLLAGAGGPEPTAEGRILYRRYCASCHGVSGDGRGPVAPVLHVPPADLRRLAERFGRPLPRERILRYVDGRELVPAHGQREMPVWGRRFHEIDGRGGKRDEVIRRTLERLLDYLESIQLPPEEPGSHTP
jgi:mono/diheme cytochrome c family protein